MAYFIPFAAVLGFTIGYLKYKNLYNPLTIFNMWWFVIGIISPLALFNTYTPSETAYSIILLGVISYNISSIFLLSSKAQLKLQQVTSSSFPQSRLALNYRLIYIVSIIVLLYVLLNSIGPILQLVSGTSLSEIRDLYFTFGDEGRGKLAYYFENYFILPFQTILITLTIIDQLFGKKKTPLFIIVFMIVLLSSLTSGGRFTMVNTIFQFLFALIIAGKITKYRKISKIGVVSGITILTLMVIYFTSSRSTLDREGSLLFEIGSTSYIYYSSSIIFLGRIIDLYPINSMLTYGANFFGGLLSPFFAVLAYLNIVPFPAFLNAVTSITGPQMAIGPGLNYNALPTIFFYFFLDFGYFGVFLASSVFAIISMQIYKKMTKFKNLIWISVYLILIIQLNNTSTKWFFYSPSYTLSFIYLFVFFKKINILQNNNLPTTNLLQ